MNNKTRLLLYGEYYKKPSGFGREIRDLIPYLLKSGYDIRQVALGFNGFPEDDQIKIYPGKFYKLESYWAREMLEFALSDFKPDIILTLGDYYMLPKIAFAMAYPRKGKWIHWGVLDGAPLGFGCGEPLKWVDYNLYHSEFAEKEIKKIFKDIKGEVFFPATDPKIFYEMDKEKLKEDFGCKDNFIISTVARNQTRKNLPALIQAMPLIKDAIPEVMLLLGLTHDTTTHKGSKEGHEIEYLIDYYEANDYIVMPREKSEDGSLSDKTIREIYNMGDIFCLPCFSDDTKIVTKNGLKKIKDCKIGDSIFSSNNGILEVDYIKKIYKYDYEGNMIEFNNKQINQLVTPNHRIYYYTPSHRKKYKIKEAKEFLNENSRWYIPTGSKWNGIEENTINLKKYIGDIKFHKNTKQVKKIVKSNIFMELLGWFIAEGCVTKGENNNEYIAISSNNLKNSKRIFYLLKHCGLNPYIDINKRQKNVRAYSKELCVIFKTCGKYAKNKTIPDWCLEYSPDILKSLWDGLMFGDGSITKKHKLYYTVSDNLKDKFVELCIKIGYSVKIHRRKMPNRYIRENGINRLIKASEDWMISIRTTNNAGTLKREHISEKKYNGKVWCVETKNNNLFIERNGLISLSGNSMGEGFGMIFHESMACGVPVLTTDCSACPYTLKGNGYLIKPRTFFHHADGVSQAVVDAEELANKIINIYNNEKTLKIKGEAGKFFVSQFTPKHQAHKLHKIIKKVIRENYQPIISK